MTEDEEIEQVKIRLHGQCPMHNGHDGFGGYFFAFLIGGYVGLVALLGIQTFFGRDYASEAIKLGYAQHNAITGNWEWRK